MRSLLPSPTVTPEKAGVQGKRRAIARFYMNALKTNSREFFVYILASCRNGTLYVGVTNDLASRTFAHREGRGAIFTKRYGVGLLVYYESYQDVGEAIAREKTLKKWRRPWKLQLIEANNPQWRDLYESL
jgi:putative endonuclease